MSRPATPKQIAYLSYMGVRNAQSLTFEQAGEAFHKLDVARDEGRNEQLSERGSAWITERFVLYPDLYASEIKKMLDDELPEVLHTYVRGQMVGASEKLTKPKIKKVIESLLGESAQWWQSKNMKEIFYRRLSELYPGCVDGRVPEKKVASKGQSSSKPPSKGISCLVILCIFLIGSALIAGFAIAIA
jgi:hypothetical protein